MHAHYVGHGGSHGTRHESGDCLRNRLQAFTFTIDLKRMDDSNANGTNTPSIPAVVRTLAQHPDLRAAAARVVGADPGAEHTHVIPSVLTMRVLLPGMEIPIATDPPEYDRIPVPRAKEAGHSGGVPPWLRRVLRHSCVMEERRYPTAKALLWLAPPTHTSLTPGTDTESSTTTRNSGDTVRHPDVHRAFCYPNGSRYPDVSLPTQGESAIAVLDCQTLWHGVEAVPCPPGTRLYSRVG